MILIYNKSLNLVLKVRTYYTYILCLQGENVIILLTECGEVILDFFCYLFKFEFKFGIITISYSKKNNFYLNLASQHAG